MVLRYEIKFLFLLRRDWLAFFLVRRPRSHLALLGAAVNAFATTTSLHFILLSFQLATVATALEFSCRISASRIDRVGGAPVVVI